MGGEIEMLKEIKTDEEIKLFGEYKVKLIKYHQQFARELGLFDLVVDKYNLNDALRHIGKDDYFQFLIVDNDNVVGILEYQITKSDIDDSDILYIKDIYIDDNFRGNGIGRTAILELKKMGYRIELECWYGMPANGLYQALGAKEIKTRYMLQ